MGWTPRQVDACSIWEFAAALEGWRRMHCRPDEDGITQSEFDEIGDFLDEAPPWDQLN